MKKIIIAMLFGVLVVLTGCEENMQAPKSDTVVQRQQEKSMQEMVRQTGLPAIKNFQEKKMLKMLYELRDREDLVCYVYLINQMSGEVGQFLGKCIGYGLPASTQYSNPQKPIDYEKALGYGLYEDHVGNIPQAEPNGLFMPEGLSATWLMMIDPETNEPRPVYVEPLIIVSPFPLK